jgi:CysZ protein
MTLLVSQGISAAVDIVSAWVYAFFEVTPLPEGATFWENLASWAAEASKWATIILLNLAFYYVYLKINKYIVLIFMSPVMALLSEKTEEILTGEKYPFTIGIFVSDVWRGVVIALRNMIIEFFWIIVISIGGILIAAVFAPLSLLYSPLAALVLFMIGAYFYGFSTLDYNSERKRMKVRASASFVRDHRWLAVANGSIFTVLLWVPFLGVIIAPITCTVAATLACHELGQLGNKKFELPRT